MLSAIKDKIVHISPEDVLEDARDNDLDVKSIEDFRQMAPHYDRIDRMMEEYRSSYASQSALTGLTTGIGGFFTTVTFATVDTISLSIQLYRLSQRFAILNGFDGNKPLQKDKMLNIYFESLGLNAVIQATMKHQFLQAQADAGTWSSSNNTVLNLIIRTGQLLGKNITSRRAGRLVPVFGSIIGATVNYSFAKQTSKRMKKAYRRAYFETWHT